MCRGSLCGAAAFGAWGDARSTAVAAEGPDTFSDVLQDLEHLVRRLVAVCTTSRDLRLPEAPAHHLDVRWRALDRAVALARLGRVAEARAAGCELAAILPEVARDPRAVVRRMTADQALVDDLVEALALAGLG